VLIREVFEKFLDTLYLVFEYKIVVDRGGKDSQCLLKRIGKRQQSMSAHNGFVSAHKEYFDLFDRSYRTI
jgi:hypothetical protein